MENPTGAHSTSFVYFQELKNESTTGLEPTYTEKSEILLHYGEKLALTSRPSGKYSPALLVAIAKKGRRKRVIKIPVLKT